MKWDNNEQTVQDLYFQVQTRYNVIQPLGEIVLSLVRSNLARALEIEPAELKDCRNFGEMVAYIQLVYPSVFTEPRTEKEIRKIKRGFASVVKMGRIKPL